MRNLFRSDRGISLTELAVAMMVTTVVAAGAITWAIAVNNADERNRETLEVVDQLRWAKTELVAELRFAEEVIPLTSDDQISFVISVNGLTGLQAGIGELVTYTITPSGVLERSTDLPSAPTATMARYLIPAQSSFTLIDTNKVVIEFVADADAGDNVNARTIKTSVNVRYQN